MSGGRDVTSYTVPEGVAYIRFSATGLLTGNNVAVVASAEKTDYEEYGATYHYVLKPEAHNDEHIRDITTEVIEAADIKSDEVWAAPIVVGITASRFELDVPEDAPLGAVVVPEGSNAESIKVWGKNYFHNDTGAAGYGARRHR